VIAIGGGEYVTERCPVHTTTFRPVYDEFWSKEEEKRCPDQSLLTGMACSYRCDVNASEESSSKQQTLVEPMHIKYKFKCMLLFLSKFYPHS